MQMTISLKLSSQAPVENMLFCKFLLEEKWIATFSNRQSAKKHGKIEGQRQLRTTEQCLFTVVWASSET